MTTIDVYKDWLGIPDGPRPPGHYELLRLVPFEDNIEKVRSNYKKLNAHVRKYASGQYGPRSQELLNELARAMLCLTDPEAKRDYDESLGRIVQEAAVQVGRRSLGKVLIDLKIISRDQLKEAEKFADARGLSLRDAVVQMKLADASTATQALAEELGHSYLDLSDVVPDDSVLDQVPRSTVKRHACLPLFIDAESVLVACADEPTQELEDEIRLRFGLPMRVILATPLAVNQGIAKYYANRGKEEKVVRSGPARAKIADLSPDEQKLRKQIGYIVLCWAFIGPILLDQFVFSGPGRALPTVRYFPALNFFPFNMFMLTLVVPWVILWWVLGVYWK